MSTTLHTLPEKSISWLQSLIQINIDSADGFSEAADGLKGKDAQIEALFRRMSNERKDQADDLQQIVAQNSEAPQESGSIAAAAHRAWMDIRAALGGGEHAILSEAERGEDHIKAKYEEALKDLGNCPCTTVLRNQYSAVIASHDKVKLLRDTHASS